MDRDLELRKLRLKNVVLSAIVLSSSIALFEAALKDGNLHLVDTQNKVLEERIVPLMESLKDSLFQFQEELPISD